MSGPIHIHTPLRATLAALLIALISLTAAAVLSAARADAAAPGVVGDMTWFPPEEDRAREAALLSEIGSKWVRLDIGWHDFEPAKGQYNSWSLANYQKEFERAKAAGQKVIVSVSATPDWANGSTDQAKPPTDPTDYADFMRFVSKRYAPWVDAWEVWNEPNYDRFWRNPNPAAYVALLKEAYGAVKQGDPTSKVVFGGLSTNDYTFVEGAYAAGAKGYFDVMALHPYSCTAPETIKRYSDGRMTKNSFPAYREVRKVMTAKSDVKPIWFTEFGWSTSSAGCGVSEATQADYLYRAFKFLEQNPYVRVATWYNLRNNWWSKDGDTVEARYGLIRSDFTRKPAYGAFHSYAHGLSWSAGSTTTAKRKWLALKATRSGGAVRVRGHSRERVDRVRLAVLRRRGHRGWRRVSAQSVSVVDGALSARVGGVSSPGRLRIRAQAPGLRHLRPVVKRVSGA